MSNRSRVHETANAPGTNVTFNLAGAVAGRRSFAQAFASGATAFYVMDDGVQSEWGLSTFTAGSPNTLARTTVYGNSINTTARLNFTGSVDVFNAVPAEGATYLGSDLGGTVGGTANALTIALPVAPPSIIPGMEISLRPTAVNTGNVTLNPNGLGDIAVKRAWGEQVGPGILYTGDLRKVKAISATEFRLAEPAAGLLELARLDMTGGQGPTFPFTAGIYADVEVDIDGVATTTGLEANVAIQVRDNGTWKTAGYGRAGNLSSGGANAPFDTSSEAGMIIGAAGGSLAVFMHRSTTKVSLIGTRIIFTTQSWYITGSNQAGYTASGFVDITTAVDGIRFAMLTNARNLTAGQMTIRGTRRA